MIFNLGALSFWPILALHHGGWGGLGISPPNVSASRQEVGEKHMTEVRGDRVSGSHLVAVSATACRKVCQPGQLHRGELTSSTKLFKVVIVNGQFKLQSKKAYYT